MEISVCACTPDSVCAYERAPACAHKVRERKRVKDSEQVTTSE